jgi:hypothetical protein
VPSRKAQWKSDTQFNYGTPDLDKVVVEGAGDSAYLRLEQKSTPTEHVPFTTPGNYLYDPAKIVVDGGIAKLLATILNDTNWPFTTPANYVYNAAKIEVAGGVGKLLGSPIPTYAWYHLNESAGATASDSSGNGRNGTLVNMEDVDWQPGKLNNGLVFDGANEYVDCGAIGQFERTDSFSLEFWIKTTDTSCSIIGNYNGSRGYECYIASSGKLFVLLRSTASGDQITRYSLTSVDGGVWTHVIVTYDGSSTLAGLNIYVNGLLSNGAGVDALTDTILGGAHFVMGSRIGTTLWFNGSLDEVVIYDKELIQAEVTSRWNGGTGTENPIGSYPLDNPSIYPATGMAFVTAPGQFIETATKPAGTEIKYHVSADDGVTWKYWNGAAWVVTDDTYAQANLASTININLVSLADSGTLKFRALLHSDDGSATPELDNVYVAEGVTFPIGSHEIAMDYDIQPAMVFNWVSTVENVTTPDDTSLKYQYSTDGGSTWSGTWLTEPEIESALQDIDCVGDGTDTLRFKFQLTTLSIEKTPEIDDLAVTYSTGYESEGTYTSYAYAPPASYYNGLYVGEITFDVVTPTGTTVTIRARTMAHPLEAYNDKPWQAYNSGDAIGMCGILIQFEATLVTTNNAKTPRLNWLEVEFHTLIGIMRVMEERLIEVQGTAEVLRKIGANRNKIDVPNSQLVVYEDDKITEFRRFDLLDEDGQPSAAGVFERDPV